MLKVKKQSGGGSSKYSQVFSSPLSSILKVRKQSGSGGSKYSQVTHSFRILSSMLKVKVAAAAGIPRFTGIALFSHPQNQTKVKKQVPPSLSIFMILTLRFSSYILHLGCRFTASRQDRCLASSGRASDASCFSSSFYLTIGLF